jgi:hypothetical protein
MIAPMGNLPPTVCVLNVNCILLIDKMSIDSIKIFSKPVKKSDQKLSNGIITVNDYLRNRKIVKKSIPLVM